MFNLQQHVDSATRKKGHTHTPDLIKTRISDGLMTNIEILDLLIVVRPLSGMLYLTARETTTLTRGNPVSQITEYRNE